MRGAFKLEAAAEEAIISDISNTVVEIHVPLTPLIGLPEGEDPFPWIDEVMDYIADVDERGEAALYDDGGEFGDVYVFLINAASEEKLLSVAARIADLPGVPAGVFAMVTDDEAEEFGQGRRVDLS
ncbi:MAG: hypothetical protein JWM50_1029 [Microbacteriaceae bacterium]|nr:hypothetical protein [Microbacteriaceae bacterium]